MTKVLVGEGKPGQIGCGFHFRISMEVVSSKLGRDFDLRNSPGKGRDRPRSPGFLREALGTGRGLFASAFQNPIDRLRCRQAIAIAPLVDLAEHRPGVLVSAQSGLKPITIESGPSNGSTRVDTKPASRIQAWQSAPV